jgi:uncharacterized protein YifN (PemK superfamily)
MSQNSPVNFIDKKQVFICDFDACGDSAREKVNLTPYTASVKPEIWKKRPVVILRKPRHVFRALVVPFTTKTPWEKDLSVCVPLGAMPGVLAKKECWALCNMVQDVSIQRLENVYRDGKTRYWLKAKQSCLPDKYFAEIMLKLQNMFTNY